MALHFIDISDKESIIEVFGSIGEGWDSSKSNTAITMSKELARIKALKSKVITVKINSLGGDVNHALAIYDLLEEHSAEVVTQVIGLCASAATIIAAAGTIRKMSKNALYLIHQCSSYIGRANEMQLASELESQQTVNKRILSIYTEMCGSKNSQEVTELFVANSGQGKWIEANEALRLGFVTDIYNETRKAACINKKTFENSLLPALPVEYADFLTDEESQPATLPNDSNILDFFRNLFLNKNSNQNQQPMKNLFPLLCLAASLADESYNKEKGATFSDEQLQALEAKLKEYADLKAAFETMKTEKETTQNSVSALQKKYDDLKAIVDKLPGEVPKVEGNDPQGNATATFADWQKSNKYYQDISGEV